MAYYNNPLPDYIEDEKVVVSDLYMDGDRVHTISYYRKIKFRIGTIVILINALEKLIENCILDLMNDRAEDERIWVFLKDFTFSKKSFTLNELYKIRVRYKENNDDDFFEEMTSVFKEIKAVSEERNTYVHCNWLSSHNFQHFETKVKNVKSENGYFRERKKISIKDLDNCITKIEDTIIELELLHEKIFYT